jgi:hypothetical protein
MMSSRASSPETAAGSCSSLRCYGWPTPSTIATGGASSVCASSRGRTGQPSTWPCETKTRDSSSGQRNERQGSGEDASVRRFVFGSGGSASRQGGTPSEPKNARSAKYVAPLAARTFGAWLTAANRATQIFWVGSSTRRTELSDARALGFFPKLLSDAQPILMRPTPL